MTGSKKKIAIPLFDDRVSPHFGASSKFLFVVTEDETIVDERVLDLKEIGPMEQARKLVGLGIQGIICGGIQGRFKEWLTKKGVAVVDNQKGSVQVVVEELLGRKK
jgi:predicted Fe-Mo cluster-binding NifX family protein